MSLEALHIVAAIRQLTAPDIVGAHLLAQVGAQEAGVHLHQGPLLEAPHHQRELPQGLSQGQGLDRLLLVLQQKGVWFLMEMALLMPVQAKKPSQAYFRLEFMPL